MRTLPAYKTMKTETPTRNRPRIQLSLSPVVLVGEAELAHDMGNSVTVLRSHYINRLVSRAEAARCWRILDAVAKRLCQIVK